MTTEDLTIPDRLVVTTRDMKITGSPSQIAELLVAIDNIYEDHERQLQQDKKRDMLVIDEVMPYMDSRASMETQTQFYKGVGEAMVSSKGTPRTSFQQLYKQKRAQLDKRNVKYPKPREIADAYIKQFGKKYDKEIAIDFIKGYMTGRRLTLKYRKRVLMSIVGIVNDSAKNLRDYKKTNTKSNGKKKQQYIRRDWDALAREYLTLEPQPSVTKFFKDRRIGLGKYSLTQLQKSLDNIKNVIHGNKVPVFSTSVTSSVG